MKNPIAVGGVDDDRNSLLSELGQKFGKVILSRIVSDCHELQFHGKGAVVPPQT